VIGVTQEQEGYLRQRSLGWVTPSTSVPRGMNVGDVIRLIGGGAGFHEHSLTYGHVPQSDVLGHAFRDLRIAGYPVQLYSTSLLRNRPKATGLSGGHGFLDRVQGN